MPSSWLSRKALVAAVALITIFLLVRHSTSPSQPIIRDTQLNKDYTKSSIPGSQRDQHFQHIVNDISSKPLRKRLEHYFPYDIESKFPSYIWQTWKYSPSSGKFDEKLRPLEASWTEKHPSFVHEVIVDDAADQLIRYLYASVPEVHKAWRAMPLPVLKADFFRYLILLARGGIYTDIDTEALKPAVEWLPEQFDQSSIGLVIGIEADPDREDWHKWYSRRIQFCQWTIQSKPGHPVLREIVAHITEETLAMQAKNLLTPGFEPHNKSVMEFTGPGIWTDTVFGYFNNKEFFDVGSNSKYQNITVKNFFGIKEQKKIGDVVVLPITSFSPGVGQMGAGDRDDPMAFVRHEFEGSWKPEDERGPK